MIEINHMLISFFSVISQCHILLIDELSVNMPSNQSELVLFTIFHITDIEFCRNMSTDNCKF